jgi:hypothetical protein
MYLNCAPAHLLQAVDLDINANQTLMCVADWKNYKLRWVHCNTFCYVAMRGR